MPDLSASDLVHAICDDAPLQDWVADRLDLPPAPLTVAPPLRMVELLPPDLPTLNMVSAGPDGTWLLHLVVGQPGMLRSGVGLQALKRAAFIREGERSPDQWDYRVALIAPKADLDACGAGFNEFEHQIAAEDLGQHLRRVMAA